MSLFLDLITRSENLTPGGSWKGVARALFLCAAVLSSPGAAVQGPLPSDAMPSIDLYRQLAGSPCVDQHSQARAESWLNPRARAADGGLSLGQFMLWAEWGRGGPYDPNMARNRVAFA